MKHQNIFDFLSTRDETTKLEKKFSIKMQSWDFSRSARLGMHIFKFDYVTNGYESSCFLPLTFPLPMIDFVPKKKNLDWLTRLLKIITHPFTLAIGTVASLTNLLALSLGSYTIAAITYKTLPLFILQGLGIGISIICLSSAITSYLVFPILRKKLIDRFNCIENEIKQPGYQNVVLSMGVYFSETTILHKIPFIYRVMLHDYLPGNMDLKWHYHYLNCLSNDVHKKGLHPDDNPYVKALEYCQTEDQQFFCLRGAINSLSIWHSKLRADSFYKKTIEETIQPYVEQISSTYKSHQELGKNLRDNLYASRNALLNGELLNAIQQFENIKFDDYSKNAFPDITVLFYELDGILGIMGKEKYPTIDYLRDGVKLCEMRKNLKVINTFISKYYKNKTDVYLDFYEKFCNFKYELPTTSKPTPGKRILYSSTVTITQLNDDDTETLTPSTRTKNHLKIS